MEETRPAPRRPWRRRVALALATLLLAPVVAALLLTQTAMGRAVLTQLVTEAANAALAGELRLASIEGSLLRDVTLRGVELHTATERRVLSVERVSLRYRLLPLLRRRVHVDAVEVQGLLVDARVEADGTLDLLSVVPPSEEESAPLAWTVDLRSIQVDEGRVVLRDSRNRDARLLDLRHIHTTGRLQMTPQGEIAVAFETGRIDTWLGVAPDAPFLAGWDDLRVHLQGDDLAMSVGRLFAGETSVQGFAVALRLAEDVPFESLALEVPRLLLDPETVEPYVEGVTLLQPLQLDARVTGHRGELVARAGVDMGDAGRATLEARLDLRQIFEPVWWVRVELLRLRPERLVSVEGVDLHGEVTMALGFDGRGMTPDELVARGTIDVAPSHLMGWPLERAWIAVAKEGRSVRLDRVSVAAMGVALEARGEANWDGEFELRVQVDGPALEAIPLDALQDQGLTGSLGVQAAFDGALPLDFLMGLQDAVASDPVEAGLEVLRRVSGRIDVEARGLTHPLASVAGLTFSLESRAGEQADLDTRLVVEEARAQGHVLNRLVVTGEVQGFETRFEARGVADNGRIELDAVVDASWDDFVARFGVETLRLSAFGERIEALQPGRLQVRVNEDMTLRSFALAPWRLRVIESTLSLEASHDVEAGDLAARVELAGLSLARAQRWGSAFDDDLREAPAVQGTLGAYFDVTGRLRAPEARFGVTLHDLHVADHLAPDVRFDVGAAGTFVRQDLQASLSVSQGRWVQPQASEAQNEDEALALAGADGLVSPMEGPAMALAPMVVAQLEARVPVDIDAPTPLVVERIEGRASLRVTPLALEEVARWVPAAAAFAPVGRFEVDAHVAGGLAGYSGALRADLRGVGAEVPQEDSEAPAWVVPPLHDLDVDISFEGDLRTVQGEMSGGWCWRRADAGATPYAHGAREACGARQAVGAATVGATLDRLPVLPATIPTEDVALREMLIDVFLQGALSRLDLRLGHLSLGEAQRFVGMDPLVEGRVSTGLRMRVEHGLAPRVELEGALYGVALEGLPTLDAAWSLSLGDQALAHVIVEDHDGRKRFLDAHVGLGVPLRALLLDGLGSVLAARLPSWPLFGTIEVPQQRLSEALRDVAGIEIPGDPRVGGWAVLGGHVDAPVVSGRLGVVDWQAPEGREAAALVELCVEPQDGAARDLVVGLRATLCRALPEGSGCAPLTAPRSGTSSRCAIDVTPPGEEGADGVCSDPTIALQIRVPLTEFQRAAFEGPEALDVAAWPLAGRVHAVVDDIGPLTSPLLAGVVEGLDGRVVADLRLGRQIGDPRIEGELSLDVGPFYMPRLGRRFREVAVALSFSEESAPHCEGGACERVRYVALDRFRVRDPVGSIRIRGSASEDAQARVRLEGWSVTQGDALIELRDLWYADPGGLSVIVGGDIQVGVRPRVLAGQEGWHADVILRDMRIRLPQETPGASVGATDLPGGLVRRVGVDVGWEEIGRSAGERAGAGGPARPAEQGALPPFAVTVRTEGRNRVEHPMATLGFRIDLGVQSEGQDFRSEGQVQLVEGLVRFAGRRFQIERGNLLFSGAGDDAFNPVLDMEVVHELSSQAASLLPPPSGERATVRVLVTGRATSPVITFRGDPDVSEEDAIFILLTGRPRSAEESDADAGSQLASAAGSLLLGALGDRISGQLPLDSIRIEGDASTGQAISRIEGGFYVGENVYVTGTLVPGAKRDENDFEVGLEWILRRFRRSSLRLGVRGGNAQQGGAELMFNIVP